VKNRELTQALDGKLPGERRTGSENNHWVVIDGRKCTRVTYPKGHSGDVKRGTLKSIADQMRLVMPELEDFVACRISRTAYEALLRGRLALPRQN
jgi:hypothetical protein